MSKASEISTNIWQGPTPEHMLKCGPWEPSQNEGYDLLIETNDLANIPEPHVLAKLEKELENSPQRLEFPSSGSVMPPSPADAIQGLENLVNTIQWLYYLANPEEFGKQVDPEGDVSLVPPTKEPRKILIHCPDGYTESSLLALAYLIFAEGIPAKEAWLKLHCDKKRNFFAYPIDVSYLSSVQGRLLQDSPATSTFDLSSLTERSWFDDCDGSLPSRILPYMYLGSLSHANNPDMLWALGIRRVLSIGESVVWSEATHRKLGSENIMHVSHVQDNGMDSLAKEFDRCLEFIREYLVASLFFFFFLKQNSHILIQRKESMTVQQLWYTVASVFPDPQLFVLPKLWRL